MQDSSQRLAIGLDIGTTTVRCVIGSLDANTMSPTIIGVGIAPNHGMRKGVVVNIVNTAQAIDRALEEAERMSGHQVGHVSVDVNGSHILAMSSKGVVAVNGQDHEIAEADLARAQEAATVVQLPANREILQVTPRSYKLDDHENIKDPLGMSGVRLEVDAHVITALTPHVKNLLKSVEMTQTQVNGLMVAGLAAAKAALTPQQTENGVAVIDLGGATTSLAVFEEGDLQHVAILPMGSINITNDLAIGLRTDLDIAEVVKLEHASATKLGKEAPKEVSVSHGDASHTFETKDIEMIVDARLDEIFELIDKELASIDRSGKLPGGVVLTGGGANLKSLADYAKHKLRLPARLAHLHGLGGVSEQIARPEFAAALGLMLSDLATGGTAANSEHNANTGGGVASSLFNRARGLLKKFQV